MGCLDLAGHGPLNPLAYVLGALVIAMVATDATTASGFGDIWVATGFVLTVVAAGLIELWLARARLSRDARLWIIALVLAPPVALIALGVWALPRASGLRRAQRP